MENRIKIFSGKTTEYIESEVNHFIEESGVDYLKFTLVPVEWSRGFIGVLEYEFEKIK